jgi:hypothetical protein
MLIISRKNSTRFADSKRSCDKRSRKYDVRRKKRSVGKKKEFDENRLGLGLSIVLHDHPVV